MKRALLPAHCLPQGLKQRHHIRLIIVDVRRDSHRIPPNGHHNAAAGKCLLKVSYANPKEVTPAPL